MMNTAIAETTPQSPAAAVGTDSMPRSDFKQVGLQTLGNASGMKLALNTFGEMEKFANFMASSTFVPKHMRNKPGDCLAVLLQSIRWEMDPFAVSQKTYFVNDAMGYEAQLVNAIINSRAPLKGRPKLTWSGEGENLTCKVSATFIGEETPHEFEAELKTITTKNSPLWKQQPKQQLGYFALRAWARLYCPDILMGVYTKEELEDTSFHRGPDNALDITPAATVTSLNDQIKASAATKPATAAPVIDQPSVQKLTEEVKEESQKIIDASYADQKAPVELTVLGWQKAIREATTADDVRLKREQGCTQFEGDAIAQNTIRHTADKRLQELQPKP